jgi:hypothetical protein
MIRKDNYTLLDEDATISTCDINILPSNTHWDLNSFKAQPVLRERQGVQLTRLWAGYQYDGNGTLDLYIIFEWMPCLDRFFSGATRKQEWLAIKGSVQPCILTLDTQVVNGRTNTTILASQPIPDEGCVRVSNQSFCAPLAKSLFPLTVFMGTIAESFVNWVTVNQGGVNYFIGPYAQYLFEDIFGTQIYDLPSEGDIITPGPIPGLRGFAKRLDILTASITNS